MKINKEIIIEELEEYVLDKSWKKRNPEQYRIYQKEIREFAFSLLSKLNKLNRENIEKIIRENTTIKTTEPTKNGIISYRTISAKEIFEIGTQILSLIPEEGEVIKGEVKCIAEDEGGNPLEFCLDTNYTTDEGDLLFDWIFGKYNGKDIEIIIRGEK